MSPDCPRGFDGQVCRGTLVRHSTCGSRPAALSAFATTLCNAMIITQVIGRYSGAGVYPGICLCAEVWAWGQAVILRQGQGRSDTRGTCSKFFQTLGGAVHGRVWCIDYAQGSMPCRMIVAYSAFCWLRGCVDEGRHRMRQPGATGRPAGIGIVRHAVMTCLQLLSRLSPGLALLPARRCRVP